MPRPAGAQGRSGVMAEPVDSGVLHIPFEPKRHGTRISDWEQGRGFHLGPRSSAPHMEAGHMTAPDRGTIKSDSSCIEGAVHTWLIFTP